MINDCNVSMSPISVLCTVFYITHKKVRGWYLEILAAMVLGHFSQSISLGKFHLKSHEPSNSSVEGHCLAETQPTAGTLLIEERRNVSAYPDKYLLLWFIQQK